MNITPQPKDYDAFGDVTVPAAPRVTSSKRARDVTVALFWSIALLLIAGRVYQSDVGATPQAHTMEMAAR